MKQTTLPTLTVAKEPSKILQFCSKYKFSIAYGVLVLVASATFMPVIASELSGFIKGGYFGLVLAASNLLGFAEGRFSN